MGGEKKHGPKREEWIKEGRREGGRHSEEEYPATLV